MQILAFKACIFNSKILKIQTIVISIRSRDDVNLCFKSLMMSTMGFIALPMLLHAAPPELTVSGNKIVTVSGSCPVFFKGADVPSLEWTNTGDPSTAGIIKSVQTTMDWGGNFIRLPMNQDRWLGTGCGATASSYQAIIDSIVNTVSGRNCYILLDLHWNDLGTAGGNNVCTSGQHDMPDDNSAAFWTSVAAHYSNNPAVFFDLYNEPGGSANSTTSKLTANAAGWSLWRWGGSNWGDGTYHSPGMQGLVTVIRATGAKNIIFAGGINWAFDLSGLSSYGQWLTDTAGTDGIAYATHIYPFKQANYSCALSCWSAAVPSAVYSTHPVVVTEFGENSGQPDTTGAWPLAVCSWAEQYCQGWVAWCMHDSATPNLVSDWNYTPTSWYGAVIKPRMASVSGGGCSGTPSDTPSSTPMPSSTRTATPLASATPSSSRTATPSGTSTPTPSGTAEPSGTASSSRTPTPSSTATATASSTVASSATSSGTRTPTGSATPTASSTPASTATSSSTRTPTSSATLISTATSSITPGPSATSTSTLANSPTRTATPTASSSSTQTALPSASSTFTDVPVGSTDTSTATISPTDSATPTAADSATFSATLTPEPSATASRTATPTSSATPSPSSTPTLAATAEPTATSSQTHGPSATSSITPTRTLTPSPSATADPTAAAQPTGSPSFSPSPTSPPGQGLRIIRSLPVPNPKPRQIAIELSGPADALQVKIWTVSLKLVGGMSAKQLRAGWSSLAIPSGLLSAKGAYFYTITATRNGASASLSKPGKLLVE